MSDDDDARDYQDFSSNDDLSDIDAGDERPTHLSKLHATRSNFSSQVCYITFLNLGVVLLLHDAVLACHFVCHMSVCLVKWLNIGSHKQCTGTPVSKW